MAIQFARIELVGRATGGNACCKSSYNARAEIKDINTNVTYNFSTRGDNVYHEVLLPKHVDKKFQNISKFMNEVESSETRKNSSLLKDIVIALPDDKELNLQDRINISHRIIDKMEWVKEGLGIQLDIHEPHDGEKNWHAHILLPKRRFAECGTKLGKKARDLDIQIRGGKNPFGLSEEHMIHEKARDVINDYFKEMGLETRVDAISINPEEHIGPVRMRSVMNAAVMRNEERRENNIEQLNSGKAVIDRVSARRSVFNRKDIQRELKCIPDDNRRSGLFSEALENNSLVALYNEDGSSANYYTTHEIRLEEQKIMRLSGYVVNEENVVAANSNGKGNQSNLQQLISDSSVGLSQEQAKALSSILLDKSGLRILRGRAGTGKSYVLGQVNAITSNSGINVIGLAPTHKAKLELRAQGFERVDTIKGMLFGLAHGRFDLPKHSILVVDEAGMIGNDDMSELLRVAATRKCNVILSGDERQLASVQRGGMFEVLTNKYGSSSILDIKRQDSDWGKSVAMAMSEGDTETAISILDGEQRIKWGTDASSSMSGLLSDWSKSDVDISDRLILAVKNKDVMAINHGARQYLKSEGKLIGEEIAVDGNHYMKGDRILITKTCKELGVINGDIAELTHVSKGKFRCNLADKEISFNPAEYSGFRHGYATTIFKSQGASISDVYVYHDGFAGIRNSYVALSRNKINLNLYANKEASYSNAVLIKQLSQDSESGSSLGYLTKSELADKAVNHELANDKNILVRGLNSLIDFASNTATKLSDKNIPLSEYYNYHESAKEVLPVEKVLDQIATEYELASAGIEDKIAVGGNNLQTTNALEQKTNTSNATKSRLTAKESFYANVVHSRNTVNARSDRKQQWDRESYELREATKFKAEQITKDLLGDPNNKLSNKITLRYGEHGKLAVRISGDKAGTWYDFSRSEGGDIFSLVQHKRGGEFKDAAEYLRNSVGMSNTSNIKLVYDHQSREAFSDSHKAKKANEATERQKAKYTQDLYARAKDINSKNVAHRYLNQERNINCELSTDIKTAGIYERKADKSFPALIAFARDKDGNITGGQRLLLDSKSNNKANVDIPKKSFGKIAGSFVTINQVQGPEVTIIAEGLETGLSIKQGLSEYNKEYIVMKTQILCSLGISNIKNYYPQQGEKIIIAADNDGVDSATIKTIEVAKETLEARGAFVGIVSPAEKGDFNDLLKSGDTDSIKESFEPTLKRHTAKTIEDYLAVTDKEQKQDQILDKNKQLNLNLSYIEKYDLPQESVINAFRRGKDIGIAELSKAKECAESVSKNMAFLVDQNVKTKGQLLEDIKHTQDIKLTADDLKAQCQKYASLKLSMAQISVSASDNNGQEDKSLQEILKIQSCIKDISPYLSTVEMMRVEHFENRLKVYDIYEQHKEQRPVEAERFKEEMQSLNRFTTSGNTKEALKYHEEEGIVSATKFAQNENYNSVIFNLSRRFNIARSDKSLSGKDYIDDVAKDSQIMRYVDMAISSGNKFASPEPKDNNLLDYANQRDVFNLVETIKSPNDIYLFKSSIEDMQKYSNREDLKLAIEIYKNQGLKNFDERTDLMCSTAIEAKIEHDIYKISKGESAKDFNQSDYMDKKKYLCSISNDQNLMRYINPKSDIGKEIEQQKHIAKGFELDR
jgi:Ti-type conjugative transfer relaxase TraA